MHTKYFMVAICSTIVPSACAMPSTEYTEYFLSQSISTIDPVPPLVHEFSSSGVCNHFRFSIAGSHIRSHTEGWRSKSEFNSFSVFFDEKAISIPAEFVRIPSTDKIIEIIPRCIEEMNYLSISVLLKRTERTRDELGYSFKMITITFKDGQISNVFDEQLPLDAVLPTLD